MTDQVEAKTITNVYYDCLERIFDFLDLESLLNVAGTCKRLQIAAAAKFGDTYGKNKIKLLHWFSYYHFIKQRDLGINLKVGGDIEVIGLKFWLPFLRCFGGKISDLYFDRESLEDACIDFLDQYINQYCVDSLKTIHIQPAWKRFRIKNFQKPSKNVTWVGITDMNLGNTLPFFIHLFPNMRCLEIKNVRIDESALGVSFPQLEELTLNLNYGVGNLTYENAVKILHANQQITTLNINSNTNITLTTLLDVISNSKSIVNLSTFFAEAGNNYGFVEVNTAELVRFVREFSFIVALNLWAHRFTANDAIFLIHQLSSLTILQLQFSSLVECGNFVKQLGNEWEVDVFPKSKYKFHLTVIITR